MRKIISLFFSLIIFTIVLPAQQIIPLYENNKIPNSKGNPAMPTLRIYKPSKDQSKGTAVIVCSGGAYRGRANNLEGIPACEKLQQEGITAFLLDYRIPNTEEMIDKSTGPIMDAERAIQYLREHARELKINPNKIGIMGFSAGGHLASTAATHFKHNYIDNPKNTNLRPDFAILVYPVISFSDNLTHQLSRQNLIGPDITPEKIKEFSNELQVTDKTPPIYLVHAIDDDEVSVFNSLYFEAACRQNNVPVQIFLYAKGGHGFGIENQTATAQWIDNGISWIKNLK